MKTKGSKTKLNPTHRLKAPHKTVKNYRQDMKPATPRGSIKHG
jgi:hypothetical protein